MMGKKSGITGREGQTSGRGRPLVLFLVFLLALFFWSEAAWAKPVGKFTKVEGVVDVLRGGKLPAVMVKAGEQVAEKDVVRTRSDARAEIVFFDGNSVRIAPRSRLDISEYAADGVSKTVLNLPRGKVEAEVAPEPRKRIALDPKANRFEIRTPNAVAGVRGTRYFVYTEGTVTYVVVTEGELVVYNPKFPDVRIVVKAGQTTSIGENRPPAPPRETTKEELERHEKDVAPGEKKAEDKPPAGTTEPPVAGVDPGPPPPPPPAAEPPVLPPYVVVVVPVTETVPVTVDTTAPVITITAAPANFSKITTAQFTFTANEPVTYEYRLDGLDGGVWTATGPSLNLESLPEGPRFVEVRATDAAGNVSSIKSHNWTTDYTLPTVTFNVLAPAKQVTGGDAASFTFTATDDNLKGRSYWRDWGAWLPLNQDTLNLTGVAEGRRRIEFKAEDLAGNATTRSYEWFVGEERPFTLGGNIHGDLSGNILSTSEGIRLVTGGGEGGWLLEYGGGGNPGSGQFKLYAGDKTGGSSPAYWLLRIESGGAGGGVFSGVSRLTYLSPGLLGDGWGTVTGGYATGGYATGGATGPSWWAQDLGLGTYLQSPLGFGGQLGNSGFGYLDLDEYDMIFPSPMSGLLGGTGSLFGGSAPNYTTRPLVGLGSYDPIDVQENSYRLWSQEWVQNGSGPTSGLHARSLLGGIRTATALRGLGVGLYFRPASETGKYELGVLRYSDLTGTLYPEIQMWELGGGITAVRKAVITTGTAPSLPDWDDSDASSFKIGDGPISGDAKGESLHFSGQDWSVFRLGLGGTYSQPPTQSWSARVGGADTQQAASGSFTLFTLAGGPWNVTGKTFGGAITGREFYWEGTNGTLTDITGGFLGTYNSGANGYQFQGMGMGELQDLPLAFFSSVGVLENNGFQDFNPETGPFPDNPITGMTGLLGGTGRLWETSASSPAPFTMMGEYDNPRGRSFWYLDFTSKDLRLGETGADPRDFNIAGLGLVTGGADFSEAGYHGGMVGVARGGLLRGTGVAIYIRPGAGEGSPNETGYLELNDISGSFYEDIGRREEIGMWEAAGSIHAVPKGTTSIAPENLYSESGSLEENEFSATVGDGAITWNVYGMVLRLTDQPWGIAVFGIDGGYEDVPTAAWSARAGRSYVDGDPGSGGDGDGDGDGEPGGPSWSRSYFLEKIEGSAWDTQTGSFTVALTSRELSAKSSGSNHLTLTSGRILGLYGDGKVLAGGHLTYTSQPLAYSALIEDMGVWNPRTGSFADIRGILGGTGSFLGGASVPAIILGDYLCPEGGCPAVPMAGGGRITEGRAGAGAFDGWLVLGKMADDTLAGRFLGIYTDNEEVSLSPVARTVGILRGAFPTGRVYREIGMFELDGTLSPVAIETVSARALDPRVFGQYLYTSGSGQNTILTSTGVTLTDVTGERSNMYIEVTTGGSIARLPYGIVTTGLKGNFSPLANNDQWTMQLTWRGDDPASPVTIRGFDYLGTKWSGGLIEGAGAGFMADISGVPRTTIAVGEKKGIFDGNAWTARTLATWMDTAKFLSMAATDPGKETLGKLGIPAVEVGRVDMTGSGNNFTELKLNGVAFFAPATGARPQLWATAGGVTGGPGVTGIYSGTPDLGLSITLSRAGGGLTADFKFEKWDAEAGKWLATINDGRGSIPNAADLKFRGAGAGTINQSNGTITGTAAGTAR